MQKRVRCKKLLSEAPVAEEVNCEGPPVVDADDAPDEIVDATVTTLRSALSILSIDDKGTWKYAAPKSDQGFTEASGDAMSMLSTLGRNIKRKFVIIRIPSSAFEGKLG